MRRALRPGGIAVALVLAVRGVAQAQGLCVSASINGKVLNTAVSSTSPNVSVVVNAKNCTAGNVTGITPCVSCPDTKCISVAATGCSTAWQVGVVGPLCTLPPLALGASANFTWSFIAADAGTLDFTVTVTGLDDTIPTPNKVEGWSTARLFIIGTLTATARTYPAIACQGTNFDVVADLTNRGTAAVINIVPSVALSPPAAPGVALLPGYPSPSFVASLAPGNSKSVTWRFEAKSPGSVGFTVTLAGWESSCGGPVIIDDSTSVAIREPLSVTVFVNPTYASEGQAVRVLADAWNCGGFSLDPVAPWPCSPCPGTDCIAVAASPGAAILPLSGPSPACSASVAPGAHAYFTWEYTAQADGRVDFTVTVTGVKTGLFESSTAFDSGMLQIQRPPRLSATLDCSYASAGNLVPYQSGFELYLNVFNLGGAEAIYAQANVDSIAPSGVISLQPCPPLANPCPNQSNPAWKTVDIPGKAAKTFTWLYRADQPGTAVITASAQALDCNLNMPIPGSNASSLTITIPSPAVMSMTVTGADEAVQGQEIDFKVRVTNTSTFRRVRHTAFTVQFGGSAAWVASATVVLKDLEDNLMPQDYAPGQERCFTVRVKLADNIPSQDAAVAFAAVGFETDTNVPVMCWVRPLSMRIYTGKAKIDSLAPNPYRQSARTGVTIRYIVPPAQGGKPVSLKVYTVIGELVRVLADGPEPSGVHEVAWNGKNSGGQPVASGLYLVVYRAFASGDTRKLAVIK
jgi:hypothetical protein